MQLGEVLGDRFQIERRASSGGFGIVYRARDLVTGDAVGLKVLTALAPQHVRRFEREAAILAELSHPNIVKYIAHGRTHDHPYLAMEWLEGEDLADALRAGPLDVADALALGLSVAQALGVAHARGLMHRDIKPRNLFLVGKRPGGVKVLDFGLARLMRLPREVTHSGVMMGTPGYMSPEQARGARDVDARTDVYALGCVLYECLTGVQVFECTDPLAALAKILLEEPPRIRRRRPGVPSAVDQLVSRMLAKSPADRPADGRVVADVLGALGPLGEADSVAPLAPSPLTSAESRVLCVLLAGGSHEGSEHAATQVLDAAASEDTIDTVVESLGGRLDPLADGGILVTFADTDLITDQAIRAARCALAMRAVFPNLPMAIATGRSAVAGAVTVGEVIDRTVSLLRAAGMTAPPILVDDDTASLLSASFATERSDQGWALRRERDPWEGPRTLLGKPSPFVGREVELGILEGTVNASFADSTARALIVTGPPGAGKSRLRHELLRRLRGEAPQAEILFARGDPMRAGSPFALVAQLIRQAAGIVDGEPEESVKAKLRLRVGRHLRRDAETVTAFLGELIGVRFPDEHDAKLAAARLDPMLMGDQLRRAWEDWLAAETRTHPILLVLEDLQVGDLPSIRFVDGALRLLSDRPLVVLALARPEVHTVFPRLWVDRAVQELRLGDLSPKASERLVTQSLGSGWPADSTRRLVERAAGNAFYLEELIRAASRGAGEELPSTVLGMAEARLAALPEESRRVVRAAAVFGRTFWAGGVAALVGNPASVPAHLAELEAEEIIHRHAAPRLRDQAEYLFRHDLIREAAYAMLTDLDRKAGHRLAADWLLSAGESDSMMLAEHLERGGEAPLAVRYYVRAVEQALEGNDLAAVLERGERGAACGATTDALGAIRLRQAEAHWWQGNAAEAERRATEALGLLTEGSASFCHAAAQLAAAASQQGRRALLVEVAHRLEALPPTDGTDQTARVVATARTVLHLRLIGEVELAARMLKSVEDQTTRHPASALARAWILDAKAATAMQEGSLDAALRFCREGTVAFEEAGNRRKVIAAEANQGYLCLLVGLYAQAEELSAHAVGESQRSGLGFVTGVAMCTRAAALQRTGQLAASARAATDAVAFLARQGNRRVESAAEVVLAEGLAATGRLDEALAAATRAAAAAADHPSEQANAMAAIARIALIAGQLDDASLHARRGMVILASLGKLDWDEGKLRLVHAEILASAGQAEESRAAIGEARRALLVRADKIADPDIRESFLANVHEHARIVELARAWLGG